MIFIGVFYAQKHPGGGSIHEIKESFPLKPFLVDCFEKFIY